MKKSKRTTRSLINEAKRLYESIYVVECFNGNDVARLDLINSELHGRGYIMHERTKMDYIKSR